ncbi:TIGR03842 family LLM class F420-dependent oxidoreductase [Agrococcus carbonis]|uniref:F420-dependent oxidoreductase, CPS_4043 family n=1 Tax=Agrococcus carbonis TaxID=684552 RepID=A0A1H1S069_9MICO|nr:TIGR03842 family LLM class F420-dependent oxidoreductase [Agrococcus carbonis]SDS41372.1 F420-dependent oxidoreductase, CPS_4043 family [Agrococcus carbonis]
MDFGAVFQTNPPASRVVQLAQLAEVHGFSHVWTFDSHILWQEPYVILSQVLAATRRVHVGPFVTNPATRDWAVTASAFATLNDMFGNRTICGIGRGDSAVRVGGGEPTTLATLREAVHVIRELGSSRAVEVGTAGGEPVTLRLPWSNGSELPVWIAAYGPRALQLAGEVGDGFILQLADVDITKWMIDHVRSAASDAGRDPDAVKICVAAPAYVGDDLAHQREQSRWFGGMVGNHVADIVARYGKAAGTDGTAGAIPTDLADYIAKREGYDYNTHGKAENDHVDFVPDAIVDRFCVLGTADDHIEKLTRLRELGVDQFAAYVMHDDKEETLRQYGERIIPALREHARARS